MTCLGLLSLGLAGVVPLSCRESLSPPPDSVSLLPGIICRQLDYSEPRTPQDRLLGPNMEEAGGPPAQAEAPVVSATLMWRRPPAQEEMRHRFHKVSLVSGARIEAPPEETL